MSRQCTSAARMAVRSGCIRIVMKSACTRAEKASAAGKCHRMVTSSGKSPLQVAPLSLLALGLLLAPLLVVQQSLPLPELRRLPPLLVAPLSLLALELLLLAPLLVV